LRRLLLFTLVLLAVKIDLAGALPSECSGASYYAHYKINNTGGGSLTDYPVFFNITREAHMPTNASNGLCFAVDSGGSEVFVPYFVEEDTSSYIEGYVNVSSLPASSEVELYVYYNTSNEAVGWANMFYFYDDASVDRSSEYSISLGSGHSFGWDSAGYYYISGTGNSVTTVYHPTDIPDNFTMEYSILGVGDGNSRDNLLGVINDHYPSRTDYIEFGLHHQANQYFYRTDESGGSFSGSFTDGVWYNLKIVAWNGVAKFYVDGSYLDSLTAEKNNRYYPAAEYYPYITTGTTYMRWKNVKVRKYAEPDPNVYKVSGEQVVANVTQFTIYSPTNYSLNNHNVSINIEYLNTYGLEWVKYSVNGSNSSTYNLSFEYEDPSQANYTESGTGTWANSSYGYDGDWDTYATIGTDWPNNVYLYVYENYTGYSGYYADYTATWRFKFGDNGNSGSVKAQCFDGSGWNTLYDSGTIEKPGYGKTVDVDLPLGCLLDPIQIRTVLWSQQVMGYQRYYEGMLIFHSPTEYNLTDSTILGQGFYELVAWANDTNGDIRSSDPVYFYVGQANATIRVLDEISLDTVGFDVPINVFNATSFELIANVTAVGGEANLLIPDDPVYFQAGDVNDTSNPYIRRYYLDAEPSNVTVDILFPVGDVVNTIFVLNDYTGRFGSSNIKVKKYIQNNLTTVDWNFFDIEDKSSHYFLKNHNYQIYLDNGVEERSLGWFTPVQDSITSLVVSDIEVNAIANDWLNYSFKAENETGLIEFVWNSSIPVSRVELWINYTNGTLVAYYSQTADLGSITHYVDNGYNYIVRYRVEAVSGEVFDPIIPVVFVKSIPSLFYPLPSGWTWLYGAFSVGMIILICIAFSRENAEIAAVLSVGVAGFFYYIDWLPVSGLAIALAAIVAVFGYMERSRKGVEK